MRSGWDQSCLAPLFLLFLAVFEIHGKPQQATHIRVYDFHCLGADVRKWFPRVENGMPQLQTDFLPLAASSGRHQI